MRGEATGPPEPKTPSKSVNLREAIALKRAEAKKAAQGARHVPAEDSVWNKGAGATRGASPEDDILGRGSIPETIERAKRNGER
jgi:hypothetical protein